MKKVLVWIAIITIPIAIFYWSFIHPYIAHVKENGFSIVDLSLYIAAIAIMVLILVLVIIAIDWALSVLKKTKVQTYRDFVNKLPHPYRTQAFVNMRNQYGKLYKKRLEAQNEYGIKGLFLFTNTREGAQYWYEFSETIDKFGNPLK